MSVVSELSIQELDAERGELLPEREALQLLIGNFNVSPVTQVGVNLAFVHGDQNYVDQSTMQHNTTDINQDFSVTE